jgi:hypothetical protein
LKIKNNVIFQILAASILMLIPLWYNGSPLYYPDSMGYIFWGMQGMEIPERAATYGLFVRYFSLGQSLWLNIYFQAFLTAFIVRILWFKILEINNPFYFLFSCLVLGLGSSLGWTLATLMPDIFCTLSAVCLFLLLFFRSRYSVSTRWFLILIFVFCSIQHVSIFLINMLLLAFFSVWLWVKGQFKTQIIGLAGLFFLVFLSNIGIGLVHKMVSGSFYISKSSGSFLIGRLAETGILGRYLDENCASNPGPLCQMRTALPMGAEYFLWNENSPIKTTGGLHDANGYYKEAIADILTSPKYLAYFVEAGLRSAMKQFFLLDIGDGLGGGEKLNQLRFFPGNESDYNMSKQIGQINFFRLNDFCYLVLAGLVFLFVRSRAIFDLSPDLKITAIFIVILLISNALVNGALSTPLNRYQVRVFWLVYLWLLAALYPVLQPYFSSDPKSKL